MGTGAPIYMASVLEYLAAEVLELEGPCCISGEVKAKIKKKPKSCVIPAVEVEHPGCSFNHHPKSHQDALARAVADEMQKIYQHELGPQPIPLVVPGEAIDEYMRMMELMMMMMNKMKIRLMMEMWIQKRALRKPKG
ncbi:probable histone H2A.3 isoform X3 [Salvia miltiorrhiza]|uniref:probable histone H2A.3 isoform X3 n=1 Tax=Salvia miltiorrhiza TaxID=226208 RepID=UPI0025AC7F7F|nr:probable histone H2A.3 isoform X3 [Salvia miltiorrhiza]XP_057773577.1 probable histone H2A.3 isoform X3 [Salvia miltiorrhiza]